MQKNPKWSLEKANIWYQEQPWLVGCNFIPSNAINQLEMWQEITFDPKTIDRELGWAAHLGFNTVRVYLHDLLWLENPNGFKNRINRYLDIAENNKIRTMFVLFDDCWHDNPRLGRQPDPVPGVHNSGWVKSPGFRAVKNKNAWGRLEDYVTDILSTFKSDKRVIIWDLYNEPGNDFLLKLGMPKAASYFLIVVQLLKYLLFPIPTTQLLKMVFTWARNVLPEQPLTSGLWYLRPNLQSKLNKLALDLSDVISFHTYFNIETTSKLIDGLKLHQRPLLCTEYLARKAGSRFEIMMPFFKQERIGCWNWGLVKGKTQTIYSWEEVVKSGNEPDLWFHDVLRSDGTPYRQEEVEMIRSLTGTT